MSPGWNMHERIQGKRCILTTYGKAESFSCSNVNLSIWTGMATKSSHRHATPLFKRLAAFNHPGIGNWSKL